MADARAGNESRSPVTDDLDHKVPVAGAIRGDAEMAPEDLDEVARVEKVYR
jgi:hypothetical protein